MVVLFTVPAVCVSVTLLPYPLPAASDTWNPAGAVVVIFAVNLAPETVNCWILGLADGVPAQDNILPDAPLAAITAPATEGLTVIVNVVGVPVQPGPPVIKVPEVAGSLPTITVLVTVLVAVLIIETVLFDTVVDPKFGT